MMELSDTDAAWFAAWLSADGSITRVKGEGDTRDRVRVQFKLTDEDVIRQLAATSEAGTAVTGPHKPTGFGKKQTWSWAVTGAKAEALVEQVWEWLSPRYRVKYTEIVESIPPAQRGRKLTDEQVHDIKARLNAGETGRSLALEYEVSDGLISAIKHGRVWKEY